MQDCPERPTHGYDGEPATFCQAHMAQGMKVGNRGSKQREEKGRKGVRLRASVAVAPSNVMNRFR